jgi:hypothetical protein
MWLVPSLAVATLLLFGAALFFVLIVAMNGFQEPAATVILAAYLVLLLTAIGSSIWSSRRGLRYLARRTQWPAWLSGPLVLVTVLAMTTLVLLGCSLAMLAIGEGW